MLEYCEEPHICRRLMLLQYMGEVFDPRKCNQMCDNCRTGLQLDMRDVTTEAVKIVECVAYIKSSRGNSTVKQLIELARGKLKPTVWLKKEVISKYQGFLRQFTEDDLRRIVIKLLMLSVLEETFVKQGAGGQAIAVYLDLHKNASKHMNSRLFRVILSKGVEKLEISGEPAADSREKQKAPERNQPVAAQPVPEPIVRNMKKASQSQPRAEV